MYLKEDLTLDDRREQAARFYLLKSTNATILNGDRISIHSGNRTLVLTPEGNLQLLPREHILDEQSTFLLTTGDENLDPIRYDSPVFFISNRKERTALKYEWGMELANPGSQPSIYRPRAHPHLINARYDNNVSPKFFQFSLEQADVPPSNPEARDTSGQQITLSDPELKNSLIPDFTGGFATFSPKSTFEGHRGVIMVVLLLILLVLCAILNR